MSPAILRAFVLVALVASSSVAVATTGRAVTVAELTRASDDVLVGTVRRSVSRWEGGHIVTDHDVEVGAVLAGRLVPGVTVTVRVAGGVVGRIAQSIPGAPTLEDGRAYMLFLAGGVSTVRYLAHMTAAVVPVVMDGATVTAAVPSTLLTVPVSGAGRPTRMALTDLTRAVGAVRP